MLPWLYFKWVFFFSFSSRRDGLGVAKGGAGIADAKGGSNFMKIGVGEFIRNGSTIDYITRKTSYICLSVLIFSVRLFCVVMWEGREIAYTRTLRRPSWFWVVSYRLCVSQERENRRKPNTNMCVSMCMCVEQGEVRSRRMVITK